MIGPQQHVYAAFGASAWSAQSALLLLQSRLSPFAGAPAIESPAGANSAGISNDARVEIHTQAALQSTNFNDTCGCRGSAGGTGMCVCVCGGVGGGGGWGGRAWSGSAVRVVAGLSAQEVRSKDPPLDKLAVGFAFRFAATPARCSRCSQSA
jgi:hypothetical protein